LKNTGLNHIVEALKELHKGGSPMSANIARKLVNNFQEKARSETPAHNKILWLVKTKPASAFPGAVVQGNRRTAGHFNKHRPSAHPPDI
jgi:hypothetical protein